MPAQQGQRGRPRDPSEVRDAPVHVFVASSLVTRMFVAPGARSCTLHA